MNNYFKAGSTIITFDDSTLASTNAAFMEVCKHNGVLSVWRMPSFPGSWDNVGLIGYRHRSEILLDIQLTAKTYEKGDRSVAESLMAFRNELAARDAACGRLVALAS